MCEGKVHLCTSSHEVQLWEQPNLFQIHEPDLVSQILDLGKFPMFINQGTRRWLQEQMKGRVMGSILHKAFGLKTLNE